MVCAVCAGREPDATEDQLEKGQKAQTALSNLVNHFILRRTNELLSKHLPPKVVQIVCCKLTPLQVTPSFALHPGPVSLTGAWSSQQ